MSVRQILGMILDNKVLQKFNSKNNLTKNGGLHCYS